MAGEAQGNPPETQTTNQPIGDPNGQAPGGVTWEQAFKEATATRDKAKADYKLAAAELEKYRAAEKAKAVEQETAQQKAQRERLEQEGKYHEALKGVEAQAKQEVETVRRKVAERIVPMSIKSAAAKIDNIARESIDDLPSLLRDKIALDPETLEVYVKGDDGKPLVDDRLQPVPVDKFIQDWVGTKPYLLIDGMPKRHGQSAGAGKRFSIEQAINDSAVYDAWKAEDPDGLAAAEKAYWSPAAAKARLQARHKSHG